MKIKYVFFDCWDTLIKYKLKEEFADAKIVYKHIVNKELCSEEEFCEYYESFWYSYYTKTVYEVPQEKGLAFILESKGLISDVSYKRLAELRSTAFLSSPLEGIKDFINYLKENNIGCSVLSNTIQTQKQTERYLRKVWKDNFPFDKVIASYDYCVKKPDPRFFKLGAKLVGVKSEDCLYIGDRFYADATGSASAGMHPIWINWKKKETPNNDKGIDYDEFTSYKEIENFLRKKIKYEF